MANDLRGVLEPLGEPRLLVLGDVMLDRFVRGPVSRVCPEAAALVLAAEGEENEPGGAARVAAFARTLGARVRLAGVVGNDIDGRLLLSLLARAGVEVEGVLTQRGRPTTVKERYQGNAGGGEPSLLLRVDRESRASLAEATEAQLLGRIERLLPESDAVLVADHAKGVCSPELLKGLIAAAREHNVPVLVDPAPLADLRRYRGAEALLPNRAELSLATGCQPGGLEEAAVAAAGLAEWIGVFAVLAKMDRDGMALALHGRAAGLYPATARRVQRVSGAGDLVLAVAGLCRAARWGWDVAAGLAALAAGLLVEREGPVCRQDLQEALTRSAAVAAGKRVTLEQMESLAEDYRREGRTLVLVNGCFDLLHAGHAAHLAEAKALGDVLVVAVNGDASVRRLKGLSRPIVPQEQRAELLAALGCVDHVLIFEEGTPHEVLRRVRPDVLAKGSDYECEEVVGREVVQGYGGRVCLTSRRPGVSTSRLVQAVLGSRPDSDD
jgi:D-beta-D-heptose 7-phosphate kinase/D-beta-D-heptose 1-phosphate adenosyltransferase